MSGSHRDRSGPNLTALLVLFVWGVIAGAIGMAIGHILGFWDAPDVIRSFLDWSGMDE